MTDIRQYREKIQNLSEWETVPRLTGIGRSIRREGWDYLIW